MQQRHTTFYHGRASLQPLPPGVTLEQSPLSPCSFQPAAQLVLSHPSLAAYGTAEGVSRC